MGAIVDKQEDQNAVDQLRAMPDDVKLWISHHMRNSLQAMMNAIETGNKNIGMQAARHMVEDLERIEC